MTILSVRLGSPRVLAGLFLTFSGSGLRYRGLHRVEDGGCIPIEAFKEASHLSDLRAAYDGIC